MNILESLKKYIRANGGSSRANNISEAVKDLDSIPQGSGGGIPEAPVDDKQYARKNGAWSEVESSGGGGMVVTVNFDESYNGVADKTLDEIIAAFDAGAFVSIKMLVVGDFNLQAPLMLSAYGEPGDRGIEAFLEMGEVTISCKSGTTWTMS